MAIDPIGVIDLNCDMGESFGNYLIGQDDEIMPWITSCNIACGFHAGDPFHIEKTLINAKKYQLRVGAHPGYPDLNGFGRRPMQLSDDELRAIIRYQVSALTGMARSLGIEVSYVKPHGALYNKMTVDEREALIVIRTIREIDSGLAIMGLAGSRVKDIAAAMDMQFIAEAFADRRYDDRGKLVSRQSERAVIEDPVLAADQVWSIINRKEVVTISGAVIPVVADSICIHGDHKNAVPILKAIRARLSDV
jgi:5-oxoprolinase (ATP-hydrolysing) subunit A